MLFSLLLCICISSFLLSTNHGYRRLVSPSSISSASAGNSNCCFHSNKFKIGLNSDEIDTSSPKVKPEYVKDLTQTLRWFSAAGIFACFIAATKGAPAAIDFCSGYLLEQCLSVDNLFVILLIFEYFGVERKDQGRALQYGLFGAMLLRGIFITLGSAILTEYHQVLLLFAGILLYSSYNILFCSDDQSQTVRLFLQIITAKTDTLLQFNRMFRRTHS